MPKGQYIRTEFHKEIARKNIQLAHNLPRTDLQKASIYKAIEAARCSHITEKQLIASKKNQKIACAAAAIKPRTKKQLDHITRINANKKPHIKINVAKTNCPLIGLSEKQKIHLAMLNSTPRNERQLAALKLGSTKAQSMARSEKQLAALSRGRSLVKPNVSKLEERFYQKYLVPLINNKKYIIYRQAHIKDFIIDKNIPKILSYYRDFIIPEIKTVIEVDGCYWHGCPVCENNPYPLYVEKIHIKDHKVNIAIESLGWNVIRVRECEINSNKVTLTI